MYGAEPHERYSDYDDTYVDQPRVVKIPRNKRQYKTMTVNQPRPHFVDKSFPKWAYDGRIEPITKFVIAEFVMIDPHINEVAKEQAIQMLEIDAELNGYYY